MTNKEWLASLPARECYDQFYETIMNKGRGSTDTRRFMIDWLDKEHTKDDEYPIRYFE